VERTAYRKVALRVWRTDRCTDGGGAVVAGHGVAEAVGSLRGEDKGIAGCKSGASEDIDQEFAEVSGRNGNRARRGGQAAVGLVWDRDGLGAGRSEGDGESMRAVVGSHEGVVGRQGSGSEGRARVGAGECHGPRVTGGRGAAAVPGGDRETDDATGRHA